MNNIPLQAQANINDPSAQDFLVQAVHKESRKGIQRAIELGADVNRISMQDIRSVEILEYLQELGLEMSLEKYGQILLHAIQGPEYVVVWRPNMELIYYIDSKLLNIDDEHKFKSMYKNYILPTYQIALDRGYDSIVEILEKHVGIFNTETNLLIMAALAGDKNNVKKLCTSLRLPEQLRDQLDLLMVEYGLGNTSTDIKNFGVQVDKFLKNRNTKLENGIKNNDEKMIQEAIEDGVNICSKHFLGKAINYNNVNVVQYIINNCNENRKKLLKFGVPYSIEWYNYKDPRILEVFLSQGIDPNNILMRDMDRSEGAETLIEFIIRTENPDLVNLILKYSTNVDFPRLIKLLSNTASGNKIKRILLKAQSEQLGEKIDEIHFLDEENEVEIKAEGYSEERVERYCKQYTTIRDNEPLYDDITVLFFIAGNRNARAECYSKVELKEIFSHAAPVYEMDGPPLGFGSGGYRGPRGPNEANPVYKLPWTGIWVDKTIPELVDNGTSVILLHPELKSIGSGHGVGQMAGQWGGHWARNGDDAVYVEDGDAQPDERETVYYGTVGWLD